MKELQNSATVRSRWASAELQARLIDFPVVVVTGARQVGKSTWLRNEPTLSAFRFIDIDDLETRGRLSADPQSAWAESTAVVLDEVQHLPELLVALKSVVDKDRRHFRAVLSGSANLLLLRSVSESLAGRAAYLELLPFSTGEWEGRPPPDLLSELLESSLPPTRSTPAVNVDTEIHRGMMPPPRIARDPVAWWDAYVRTYVERDLRDLSQVHSLPDFRRLVGLLALRSGQVLDQAELARTLGSSQASIHRHLSLLEISYLYRPLPAFSDHRGKRLTKRPKTYLVDPGLSTFLCGTFHADDIAATREAGALFETLVLHHLRVLASLLKPPANLYHWRTSDGKEVDIVLIHGRRMIAFECKRTQRPSVSDAAHLRLFRELYPECQAGVVVHTGSRTEHLGAGIVALPWTVLAGML